MIIELYPKLYLYQRIVQAKLFIDSHYSERLDLNKVADESFFSKFHFLRQFKKIYGRTPHQYLITVRIENARQLLQNELPVSETCFSVGFESISSFSALFKKIVGKSPVAYLMQQKKLKSQVAISPISFVPSCFALQYGWNENSNFEEEVF